MPEKGKTMNAEITVKENYEFRRIYRKGKSVVTPYLVLYCQKNRQGKTRLGVTVSTKLGKAVIRNRARRRLREVWRLHLPEMHAGWDIVLVARSRCVEGSYQKMEKAYLHALAEVGLLKETE